MEPDTTSHKGQIGTMAAMSSRPHGLRDSLTEDEFDRYSRQMVVPGMGKEGKHTAFDPTLFLHPAIADDASSTPLD